MAAKIKKITIENFRSIGSLSAEISPLTVLVGKNDCGKSNILRALNLFFNGKTSHNTEFNFDDDYNFFAPSRKRKAKEISVCIEIDIPGTYKRTNGNFIKWEKRWRRHGLVSGDTNYHGVRLGKNRRGNETREVINIPDKSEVVLPIRPFQQRFKVDPGFNYAANFSGAGFVS